MMRIACLTAFFATLPAAAGAQAPVPFEVIQQWECAAATCTTSCTTLTGNRTYEAKTVRVLSSTGHPRSLWLELDGRMIVLGDADRCDFGGESAPITYPNRQIAPTKLTPPKRNCNCIGAQDCAKLGCSP